MFGTTCIGKARKDTNKRNYCQPLSILPCVCSVDAQPPSVFCKVESDCVGLGEDRKTRLSSEWLLNEAYVFSWLSRWMGRMGAEVKRGYRRGDVGMIP